MGPLNEWLNMLLVSPLIETITIHTLFTARLVFYFHGDNHLLLLHVIEMMTILRRKSQRNICLYNIIYMEKFYTQNMTTLAQAQYYIEFNYEHILNTQ